MDFQQKMIEYAKYGITVKTSLNNDVEYYMVCMTFGGKWKILDPGDNPSWKNVMCAKINNNGTYCYMTEFKNGITSIFEVIDETIRYNDELDKKVELLKVKAEELKELFATKNYDELVRLKFVIETLQEASPSKAKKKSKVVKNVPVVQNTEQTTEGLKKDEAQKTEDTAIVPTETKCDNFSDIDKKIAAAMNE